MAVILFANSMFGILSVLRTINHFRSREVVAPKTLTKIGTGSCALIIAALFLCVHEAIPALISIAFIALAQFILLSLIERRQIEILKLEVPGFFDRWILNMKLGNSLSAARTAALKEIHPRARALLEPLFMNPPPETRSHLILSEKVLPELLELGRSSHSALARLENIRAWMRKSDAFRRKSGQATRQTTIQASVLLILLIALAIFTVHRYGWRRNSDLVFVAFILSGLGIFTMRHFSVKRRWKI